MGKLTISFADRGIPADFKSKFGGKTFEVKVPDAKLKDGDDEIKAPKEWENGDKLKVLLKEVKPVKDALFAVFDDAEFTSTIKALGTHDVEVKFKGNVSVKAEFKLLSEAGAETRLAPVTAERKLGANPGHVKILYAPGHNLANSGCPAKDDLRDLLTKMSKTAAYVWSGKQGLGNGWTPDIAGHSTHVDPGVKGWKAYIDEPSMGTGTTWRLLFKLDYNEASDTLSPTLVEIREDH